MKGIEKDRDTEGMKQFWESMKKGGKKVIKLPKSGMIELSPKHQERMYRQNRNKYRNAYTLEQGSSSWDERNVAVWKMRGVLFPDSDEIEARTMAVDKFTIVELVHNGKHYHGLSAQANCDDDDVMTGIYNAYHRAFKSMIGL